MSAKLQDHILVVRLSAMGDVAMLVPVLLALVEQHPDVKITVVSKSFFYPIFKGIPNLTFYGVETQGRHKGFRGIFKLFKELKPLHITAVADVHNVLRSNLLSLLFLNNGIAVKQINKGRKEKKALVRSRNKQFKQLRTSQERYADVFRKLHFPIVLNKEHVLPKKPLNEKMIRLVGREAISWIGIAPFAAYPGKTYPFELMKDVISRLAEKNQFKILLFGSKAEANCLQTLEETYSNVINIAGKILFEEELKLISNVDVMVAMDSGNAHLAAMFGVKTITLWGVTHPYAGFYPFQQPKTYALLANREKYPLIPTSVYGNKMPENYKDIMKTILPQDVEKLVLSIVEYR